MIYYAVLKDNKDNKERNTAMNISITDIRWDKDEGDDTALPVALEIPLMWVYPNISDDISDWLSSKYGYCHFGFEYDFKGGEQAKVIASIRKILTNPDLCAEAMVSEIGELVK